MKPQLLSFLQSLGSTGPRTQQERRSLHSLLLQSAGALLVAIPELVLGRTYQSQPPKKQYLLLQEFFTGKASLLGAAWSLPSSLPPFISPSLSCPFFLSLYSCLLSSFWFLLSSFLLIFLQCST